MRVNLTKKDIIKSMRLIWDELKIIIEPSCAITLAALKKDKKLFLDSKVGLILSGGKKLRPLLTVSSYHMVSNNIMQKEN